MVATGAAVASIGLGLFGVPSTSAQTLVPGVVDLTPSVSTRTPEVTVGANVLFAVTVGQGAVATPGTATVTLPTGFAFVGAGSDCGATIGSTTVTCNVPATLADTTYDFVAKAPAAVPSGASTITVNVAATDDPLSLEYTPDNSATLGISVINDNNKKAAGLVRGGESLTLTVGDGRVYTLKVPVAHNGVIVEITPQDGENSDGAPRSCGTRGCGAGFGVVFDNSVPEYTVDDQDNPLEADFTFGPNDPCRGLGNECTGLYFAKDVEGTVLVSMSRCPGSSGGEAGDGTAYPDPCLNAKYKQSGTVWFDVRMTSEDPVKLPPLSV